MGFNQLKLLKVQQKSQYVTSALIHVFIQSSHPHWSVSLQTIGNKADVQTKHVNSLHDKRSHMQTRQMQIQGPEIWNHLPQTIKNISLEYIQN